MFKLLRQMQNLHKLTWDHGILYADKPSDWIKVGSAAGVISGLSPGAEKAGEDM
jgi:hypothetical protein